MPRKLLLSLFSFTWLALLLTAAGLFYTQQKLNRTIVIDVIRVFNEFTMKKELDARVTGKMQVFTDQLDSLKTVYGMLAADSTNRRAVLAETGNAITGLEEGIAQAYQTSDKTINDQVWLRLNGLIDAFGKEHDYRLIIGANGMGTVLYNESVLDKTDELIQFVNRRYEKGN